jgi:hypothetical protein
MVRAVHFKFDTKLIRAEYQAGAPTRPAQQGVKQDSSIILATGTVPQGSNRSPEHAHVGFDANLFTHKTNNFVRIGVKEPDALSEIIWSICCAVG